MTLLAKVGTVARAVGDPALAREVLHTARERWSSEHEAFGLRRDFAVPVPVPGAAARLRVRDYRADDAQHLVAPEPAASAAEKADRELRRRLLAARIGTPLVVAEDEAPVYLQWAFSTADDAAVRTHFGGAFPPIGAGTVLLENLFVPGAQRGRGFASLGMVLVAEHVRDRFGAREAITFVGVDNVASLRAVGKAGFVPYLRRVQRWRRFGSTVEFAPLT